MTRIVMYAVMILAMQAQLANSRVLFLQAATPALASSAPPSARYYIFGYGSLLNAQSTAMTNCGLYGLTEGILLGLDALVSVLGNASSGLQTLQAAVGAKCSVKAPRVVRVPGLERGWFAPVSGAAGVPVRPSGGAFNPSYTALGAIYRGANSNVTATGLVYEVGEAEYQATLAREVPGGYAVIQLPGSAFQLLGGQALPPDANVTLFSRRARGAGVHTSAHGWVGGWAGDGGVWGMLQAGPHLLAAM